MGEIKQILVPTDFSENAEKAIHYAVEIAGAFKADIFLLHSYYPYALPFDEKEHQERELEHQQEETKARMKETESLIYSKNKDIVTHRLIRAGKTVDVVLDVAREKDIDLIIMGTKGASGVREALLGTNTAEVISSSPRPVLAVPEKAKFTGIKDVIFASEFLKADDLRKLKTATTIFETFKPDFTLLDLVDGMQKEKLVEIAEDDSLKSLLDQTRLENPCSGKTDKEKCIRKYLSTHNADILCLSRKKKNFWQSLFGGDYVKEFAYHADLPLLVIPA